MSLEVKFDGKEKVKENIGKLKRRYPEAMAAALYQEGNVILGASLKKTPVDTGRLRATGYVSPPVGEDNPIVEIGYGTDYGIYVHERTELRHTVGESKFLEKAVNEASGGYLKRLGERVKDNEKRGIRVKSIPKIYPTNPKDSGR
jgi:hypothetical protein